MKDVIEKDIGVKQKFKKIRIRSLDGEWLYKQLTKNDMVELKKWEYREFPENRENREQKGIFYDLLLQPSLEREKLLCITGITGGDTSKKDEYLRKCTGRVVVNGKEVRGVEYYYDALISIDLSGLFDKIGDVEKLRAAMDDNGELNKKKGSGRVGNKKERYYKALVKLYRDGITLKGRHYVEYKRSASQAKQGKHLFIAEELRDIMRDWNWMGIHFEKGEEVNLTEVKAYESLVNSTIKRTIRVKAKNILLVGDLEYSFRPEDSGDHVCWVRNKNNGTLYVDRSEGDGNSVIKNKVFDGEGLLDESVFEEYAPDKSMMLLRNRFFKCCTFRTDIQRYYRDYFEKTGEKYEDAYVYDMFGVKKKVKDVKLIFTPSSLKFFKFEDIVKEKIGNIGEKEYSKDAQGVYQYWKDHIGVFGVVKYESEDTGITEEDREGERTPEIKDYWSRDGKTYSRLSYQMINTLPLTQSEICPEKPGGDEEDEDYLLKKEFNYVRRLRDCDDEFISFIGGSGTKITTEFVRGMSMLNWDFLRTKKGKQYRSRRISDYMESLKKGTVRVEGDYYVLCSMPLELLKWSASQGSESSGISADVFTDREKSDLKRGQVYIEGEEPGRTRVLFRNPHQSPSGVAVVETVHNEELEKYFKFKVNGKSNILVLSPANWDIMEKLSGADFDSDTVLAVSDAIVLKAAEELKNKAAYYPVPHNDIESKKKANEHYGCAHEMILLDCMLSKNAIGKSANLAQALCSIYWKNIQDGQSEKDLEQIYDDILLLGQLSSLEIDKAKHNFAVDTGKIIKKIRKVHIGDSDNNYPLFMKPLNAKEKSNESDDECTRCPMDYVYVAVSDFRNLFPAKPVKTVAYDDVFYLDTNGSVGKERQNELLELMSEYLLALPYEGVSHSDVDWEEREKDVLKIKDKFKRKFKGKKLSQDELKWFVGFLLYPEEEKGEKRYRKWCKKNCIEALYGIYYAAKEQCNEILQACRDKLYENMKTYYDNSNEETAKNEEDKWEPFLIAKVYSDTVGGPDDCFVETFLPECYYYKFRFGLDYKAMLKELLNSVNSDDLVKGESAKADSRQVNRMFECLFEQWNGLKKEKREELKGWEKEYNYDTLRGNDKKKKFLDNEKEVREEFRSFGEKMREEKFKSGEKMPTLPTVRSFMRTVVTENKTDTIRWTVHSNSIRALSLLAGIDEEMFKSIVKVKA